MTDKIINNFFFIILAFLPISFVLGAAVSLANIIIFDLFFIVLMIYKKEFYWINKSIIKILFFIYLYLILNTFISLDHEIGFYRNFGFLRFIILFIGINYFFNKKKFYKIFIFWSSIIFIIVFDIFFEKYYGSNILGYGGGHPRVVSFFKDEAIPGGFVYSFSLMLFGFFLIKYKECNNYLKFAIISSILILLLAVILTGERSNSIKFILSIFLLFFIVENLTIKKKFLILFIFSSVITVLIVNNNFLKNRMFESIKFSSSTFISSFNHGKPNDNPSGNLYSKLYRSGFDVFKQYPIYGVGNKNYRLEACLNNKYNRGIHIMINDYVCMTHPHQIYFEFLSEHGLVGTLILLFLFSIIFFKVIKKIILNKDYISMGCFSYLIIIFTPILPSGAFFTDYNLSLFFINLSIMYASSNKLNIFTKIK